MVQNSHGLGAGQTAGRLHDATAHGGPVRPLEHAALTLQSGRAFSHELTSRSFTPEFADGSPLMGLLADLVHELSHGVKLLAEALHRVGQQDARYGPVLAQECLVELPGGFACQTRPSGVCDPLDACVVVGGDHLHIPRGAVHQHHQTAAGGFRVLVAGPGLVAQDVLQPPLVGDVVRAELDVRTVLGLFVGESYVVVGDLGAGELGTLRDGFPNELLGNRGDDLVPITLGSLDSRPILLGNDLIAFSCQLEGFWSLLLCDESLSIFWFQTECVPPFRQTFRRGVD